MRILATGDLHGNSRRALELAVKAEKEKVDLVVIAGDLMGFVETKGIIKPFKDRNKKVLIVPGNWDSFATTDFLANFYGISNIHGYSAIYENIGFFGAGGTSDGAPGPGNISEKKLMETLEKAHKNLVGIEKKIMITHGHPLGSKSEFSGIPGSKSILNAIKKFEPDFLIHGHIHEASGMEEFIGKTKVINVSGRDRIIDI